MLSVKLIFIYIHIHILVIFLFVCLFVCITCKLHGHILRKETVNEKHNTTY